MKEHSTDPSTDPAPQLHELGGPLPTLPPGIYHRDLAYVIQQARGRVHAGIEPMEIGDYIAERRTALGLGNVDLRCIIGYLLKAEASRARLELLRSQRAARAHVLEVVRISAGPARRASCSCGWQGPERGTLTLACSDALEHDARWRPHPAEKGVAAELEDLDGNGAG